MLLPLLLSSLLPLLDFADHQKHVLFFLLKFALTMFFFFFLRAELGTLWNLLMGLSPTNSGAFLPGVATGLTGVQS